MNLKRRSELVLCDVQDDAACYPVVYKASRNISYASYFRDFKMLLHIKTFNSRKGQRTNQKYRNLVGSDQQMQWLP